MPRLPSGDDDDDDDNNDDGADDDDGVDNDDDDDGDDGFLALPLVRSVWLFRPARWSARAARSVRPCSGTGESGARDSSGANPSWLRLSGRRRQI